MNLLVSPTDKDTTTKNNSVSYWFRCDRIEYEDEYIGEYLELLEKGINNI